MGNTKDKFEDGGGNFGWSLIISGSPYILTTSNDTAAVATAYTGTGWTSALSGLVFGGELEQSIVPWDHTPDVPMMTFRVYDVTGADTFGVSVWKSKPDYEARLTATFEPTEAGGTIQVENSSAAAASGTVYLGGRAYGYTSKTASSFAISAAGSGKLAPFASDTSSGGETMPWHHPVSPKQSLQVAANPRVSDSAPTSSWLDRDVALYMHAIRSGVWDTRDEAELVFAGTIKDLQDATDGATVLVCEDMRQKIIDAELNKNQFTGKVAEGVWLPTGIWFQASDDVVGASAKTTDKLYVVASGASGANEINEGYYPIPKLHSALNKWLVAERVANNLNALWAVSLSAGDAGQRTTIEVDFGSGNQGERCRLVCTHKPALRFMGFVEKVGTVKGAGHGIVGAPDLKISAGGDGRLWHMNSDQPPLRALAFQRASGPNSVLIDLDSSEGEWVTLPQWLPGESRSKANGEDYGYLRIGDCVVFCKHESDTSFSNVDPEDPISLMSTYEENKILSAGITVDDQGDLEVAQIVAISGPFSEIVPRLIASNRGNYVNHKTYDEFPFGAGIPWALLGQQFLNSLKSLEQASVTDSMLVLLEKPTKLLDVLGPAMAMRYAWLMFYNGGYVFRSPPVPNSTTADHALTEDNKGGQPGDVDSQRTVTEVTADPLRNVLVINFNRDINDKYHAHLTIEDTESIGNFGEREVKLDARDSFGEIAATGTSVEALSASLAARMFPAFAKPLKRFRRPLFPTKWFDCVPGDTASLADNFVRDPTTGERGISNRACTVLRVWFSFGQQGTDKATLAGEIDLLYSEEDRTFPYAPTAEFNGTTSGNTTLLLDDHAYSDSTEDEDWTHFANSDVVRVMEVDPANPAAADTFVDSIASGGGTASPVLTAGFGSGGRPARDAAKTYRLVFEDYDSCQTTQRDCAFQADDSDGLIQNLIAPNLWGGTDDTLELARATLTDLPERHVAEMIGEGKPLSSHMVRHVHTMANALQNWVCPPCCPTYLIQSDGSETSYITAADEWFAFAVALFPIGAGQAPSGWTRLVHARVRFRASSGTAKIRMTLSKHAPKGEFFTDATFRAPYSQATWETASTSAVVSEVRTLIPYQAAGSPGCTFITLEANAPGAMFVHGAPELYLGPLVRAVRPRNSAELTLALG